MNESLPPEIQDAAMHENIDYGDMNHFQRWIYTMRREMQEIVPGVWLGPYASAMRRNEEQLNQIGITHIILIRGPNEAYYIRPHFPERISYLTLDISDKPSQNIIQYFRKACEFIDQCLANNGKVLIHGISGISRSASLVIAYVMTRRVCSFEEAYKYVQHRRFCIHPNESFKRQLMEFEPIFRAQMNRNEPYDSNHPKRPLEEDM